MRAMTSAIVILVVSILSGCDILEVVDEGGDPDLGSQGLGIISHAIIQTFPTTSLERTYHTAASVTFSAVIGTKYRLRSMVKLINEAGSPKSYILATARCREGADTSSGVIVDSLTDAQNILSGETLSLYPRIIWTPTASGVHTCYIAFSTQNGSGIGEITITDESYVETIAVHPSSQDSREDAYYRLEEGQGIDIATDDNYTLPRGADGYLLNMAVSGDVGWTVCRSSDAGDFGDPDPDYPCARTDAGTSATLRHQIAVWQRQPNGDEWCHKWYAYTSPDTMTIDGATTHHASFYGSGAFVPDQGCGDSARLKLTVWNEQGDPVAIHKQAVMAILR